MKYFPFIFALFFAQPAFAGDITVVVNGVGETWTLSPADQERLDAWILENYKCPSPLPSSAPLPNPAQPIPGPPHNCPNGFLSIDEAKAAWAKAIIQGTLGNVIRGNNRANDRSTIDTRPLIPIKKTDTK
jgi:hypothetical protein